MMKGLLAPQNTFLDTIATRFDGTRKFAFQLFSNDMNLLSSSNSFRLKLGHFGGKGLGGH